MQYLITGYFYSLFSFWFKKKKTWSIRKKKYQNWMWLWFQYVIYWPGCVNLYTYFTIYIYMNTQKEMRYVFRTFELVNCQVFTIIMTLEILWQKKTICVMAKSVVGRKKTKHKTHNAKTKQQFCMWPLKELESDLFSEKWINGLLRSCKRMRQFEWQWCFEPVLIPYWKCAAIDIFGRHQFLKCLPTFYRCCLLDNYI